MLSIVVPVHNEIKTLGTILAKLIGVFPHVAKQIIVVDDGSNDGTQDWLRHRIANGTRQGVQTLVGPDGVPDFAATDDMGVTLEVVYHEVNRGKGVALRTAFEMTIGDVVVIQDADLEYDPCDWKDMYDLIAVRKVADVVYGSRFLGRPHRSLRYHHYLANRLISTMVSICCNQTLTDIETCYKMMTRDVLRSLRLTVDDFGIEVEITVQIARQRHLRIYETAISYHGRTHAEGKKINWTDGFKALWYIFKFRYLR